MVSTTKDAAASVVGGGGQINRPFLCPFGKERVCVVWALLSYVAQRQNQKRVRTVVMCEYNAILREIERETK